jgi:hypothetical protein
MAVKPVQDCYHPVIPSRVANGVSRLLSLHREVLPPFLLTRSFRNPLTGGRS